MAKYLISFPSAAMVVPDGEWEAVGRDAHAVIDEAKAAGVYVFGGGIDEDVPPVLVSADGAPARRRRRVGRAHRESLSLRPGAARLRLRPAVLRAAQKSRRQCGRTRHSSRRRFAVRLHSGGGCSCRWHHDTLEMPTGIVIRKVSQP